MGQFWSRNLLFFSFKGITLVMFDVISYYIEKIGEIRASVGDIGAYLFRIMGALDLERLEYPRSGRQVVDAGKT